MLKIMVILGLLLVLDSCSVKKGLKIPGSEQMQMQVIGYDHEGNMILVTK